MHWMTRNQSFNDIFKALHPVNAPTNLVKWHHKWRHQRMFVHILIYISVISEPIGTLLKYQNDGLDQYFSEEKKSGHDVSDDVIKRHLWCHIGFKTSKHHNCHNFVVFRSIWTIDTPKSRYWNEPSTKYKNNYATTIWTPYMTS